MTYVIHLTHFTHFTFDELIFCPTALFMIVVQFGLMCGLKALVWWSLWLLSRNGTKLRVMILYGCTQKTISCAPAAGGASAGGGTCWSGAIFGDYFENKLRKKSDNK
jgi:hypothetical protein